MSKRSDLYYIKRLLFPMIVLIAAVWFGMHYMGYSDFSKVLGWWLSLLVIGLAFQPLSIVVFHRFHDGGWLFSKILGLAIAGWFTWFLSSCHILNFTKRGWSLAVVILCFIANVVGYSLIVGRKNRKKRFLDSYSADMICSIFSVEVLFLTVFIGWCYIKGINPDAYGTERFMDYSYMMSLSKTKYMPAADVWFSGNGINYYYVGQYMATFLAKVSGIGVAWSYNLAMMMLAALGICLPYSLASNLMRCFLLDRRDTMFEKTVEGESEEPFWRPLAAGTIAGIAVGIAGNLHYPIYKFLFPKWQYLTGSEEHYNYWFPDATRFIGYNPDVPDKTIHEFPIYSYVVGDLHAHVINTIFVFTVLALLFSWLLYRKERMRDAASVITLPVIVDGEDAPTSEDEPQSTGIKGLFDHEFITELFRPEIVLLAFLVGIFYMTNTWDFAIYFVVSGAIILFSNLTVYGFRKRAWLLTGAQAVLYLVMWFIVSLPFRLNFISISSSVAFCSKGHHTPLWQLFVLWGLPVTGLIAFFLVLLHERKERRRVERKQERRKGKARKLGFANTIRDFFGKMTVSELFVMTIGLCGIGLVLLPEIIYVVDIYGGAYQRANTMFKLTYQSFIMFGIAIGFIIPRFLWVNRTKVQKGVGIVLLLAFLSTVGYFNEALTAWFTGYYRGLDASAFIEKQCSEIDSEAIDYINKNIPEQCTILEMCGLSYTYFNRISVFTGNSTVLGWQTHEWLWRSNGGEEGYAYPAEVSERHDDVITIYTSTDSQLVRSLIEKYDIDYIYIGECERVDGYAQYTDGGDNIRRVEGSYYNSIPTNVALLTSLGEVVFREEGTSDQGDAMTTYLVRVKR